MWDFKYSPSCFHCSRVAAPRAQWWSRTGTRSQSPARHGQRESARHRCGAAAWRPTGSARARGAVASVEEQPIAIRLRREETVDAWAEMSGRANMTASTAATCSRNARARIAGDQRFLELSLEPRWRVYSITGLMCRKTCRDRSRARRALEIRRHRHIVENASGGAWDGVSAARVPSSGRGVAATSACDSAASFSSNTARLTDPRPDSPDRGRAWHPVRRRPIRVLRRDLETGESVGQRRSATRIGQRIPAPARSARSPPSSAPTSPGARQSDDVGLVRW